MLSNADTGVIASVIEGICSASADGYETTVSYSEELQLYGLDKPMRVMAAFEDGTIRDLQIGGDAGNGEVYVRMDRTGDVYRIGRTKLAFLQNTSLNSLLNHFVLLLPIQQMARVEAVQEKGALLLEQRFSEDGEVCAYINGASVTEGELSGVYSKIISLLFDQAAPPEASQGEALCTITMTMGSGTQQIITYSTYDEWYYLAEISSGGSFLIRREKVDSMLEEMKGVLQCS